MKDKNTFSSDVPTQPFRKYQGIYIPHRILDAESKAKASGSLKGWKSAELTPTQWIEKLTIGQTIQPSTFKSKPDGTFTHSKSNWVSSYWFYGDADHIKGVEFLDDGTDKNPNGVEPFTNPSKLFAICNGLHDKVYAITESVSSMSDDKPPQHRRYRLIFLFDEPIRSEEHYHSIILALSKEYPLIQPGERSPAQPVFGNARDGYKDAHIFGNVLSFSDYPEPQKKAKPIRQESVSERPNKDPVAFKINEPVNAFIKRHGIHFDLDGKSDRYYPKSYCTQKKHKTNTNAVGFFQNDDGSINGYCNGCGGFWYLQEPTHKTRKPIKLQDLTPYKKILETLNNARGFIKKVYETSTHLFALRTDTGTGKTDYPTTTYALTHETVIATSSHRLASEVSNRAEESGIKSFVYKGIGYQADPKHGYPIDGITYDQSGYFGCIHSERFEILRSRGFNPYEHLCGNCEVYAKCKVNGHLSQPDKARASQLKTLPFATAFIDPRLHNWADIYRPRGKNTLILHDDIPTRQLFIEYHFTAAQLRQIYQDWTGTLAADWAKECLTAFSLQDWESLKNTILGMSADTYQSVTDALTNCIDPSTNAIIEPNEYLKLEQVNYSTPESCLKLPHVDKPNYDAATMLTNFFTRYGRIIDAPLFYEKATEKLTFYLPPKPYIFNKSARLGFASATMEKKIMQAIFPEIEFHDNALTEWVDGAGFYQLRTNGNPRRTVLKSKIVEKDGKKSYVYDGLSATGQSYYDKVINFIKAHRDEKHAVLSYKAVIDEKECELDTLGVVTAWFGNLAGLDTEFDGVKHFHILFCPEVGDMGIDMLLKQVYGNDPTPILRNDDGELLRNDDRTFADERAQIVYLSLVIGEIRQAIGRARLNLYPNKVYLWTSRFINGYTNRKESVLFDENDWELAENNINRLSEVTKEREKQEVEEEKAIASGDAKAVAELTGVSVRHARRLTQEPRQKKKAQEKAERDAQVIELHQQGLNASEIDRETGVPRATVCRILKAYKTGDHNGHALKGFLNADVRNGHPHENPESTGFYPDHDTFFKLLDISTCFYGKQQLSPSEVSRYTGIDESEVRRILDNWYQDVVISPGIGEKYWMTERDKKNLWDKILGPTHSQWEKDFPGQKILCPPTLYNPHITATASEH